MRTVRWVGLKRRARSPCPIHGLSKLGTESMAAKSVPGAGPSSRSEEGRGESEGGRGGSEREGGSRPVCQYGEKCYRKNPRHFQEFAHPWLGTPLSLSLSQRAVASRAALSVPGSNEGQWFPQTMRDHRRRRGGKSVAQEKTPSPSPPTSAPLSPQSLRLRSPSLLAPSST